MKKILIIGSQGYLGSRLSDYLIERRYDVSTIDIGLFQFGVIYYPRDVKCTHLNAKDIQEKDLIEFDTVVLLAGISNDPFGNVDPEKIYNPTREYAFKIASLCKKLRINFIFPSSCSVYGIAEGSQSEQDQANPQTHYSINKIQIEEDLKSIADKSFSPIALRLATVFGLSPRIRFDVVINMLCGMAITERKIILNSNGLAWRPHVYIEDVCKVFEYFISNPSKLGELLVVNVGKDQNNLRVIDIVQTIQKYIPDCRLEYLDTVKDKDDLIRDRKINDGVDKRNYKVSFKKITNQFPDLKLEWDVDIGIKQTLEDLSYYKLSLTKFKQIDFYRLQQIEFLQSTNQLDL